jgi:hypothetical protein
VRRRRSERLEPLQHFEVAQHALQRRDVDRLVRVGAARRRIRVRLDQQALRITADVQAVGLDFVSGPGTVVTSDAVEVQLNR